ncbi:hypothetical protein LCGC14_1000120 [marine sediment metagenome]|uniref:Phage gp6-like head-tail connector protein n=1 Tax=marine sediment metagenome TaxID=412755 RepID=A0A0F9NPT9_9ZZZZ
MSISVIQSPGEEPVTISGAKQHLRVTVTDDDALIGNLVTAGQEYIEQTTGVALVSGTLLHSRNTLAIEMELPRAPVASIESVVLVDQDSVETTVSSTVYELDSSDTPNKVILSADQSWPSVDLKRSGAVKIQFVAGYGDAEDVPETLKAALKLLVGHWYENREGAVVGVTTSEVPFSIKALLASYKIHFRDEA